jgi:hypothetical protein
MEIRQRIEIMKEWLRDRDPMMEPEWTDHDISVMKSRDIDRHQYAKECIENYEWIMSGGE